MPLPPTGERAARNTSRELNQKIWNQTIDDVTRFVGADRQSITDRIEALEHEWDVERTLEANASAIILLSLVLAVLVSPWFLILTAIVPTFLLQHALQGWCPPLPLFRGMGVRTLREIDAERQALRLMRGDFDQFQRAADLDRQDVARLLEAIRG